MTLTPTVAQKARAFLQETRMEAPPWLGVREILDGVADLFLARQVSRERLEAFLAGLAARSPTDAETLRPDEVAEVIETLSRLLRENRRSALDAVVAWLQAPAVTALLLLGIAAGCAGTTGATDVGATDASQEATLTDSTAKALLDGYIDGSGLASTEKDALHRCIDNGFTPAARVDLADLFQTMTPDQIATSLEQLLANGGKCYVQPVPKYKGLTFPGQR